MTGFDAALLALVFVLVAFGWGMWVERNHYREEAERCLEGWHKATSDGSETFRKLLDAQDRLTNIKHALTE